MSSADRTVAAFDFDGTLTHRDSLMPFLVHASGWLELAWNLASIAPTLFAYGIGAVPNDQAKERLLTQFFAGVPLSDIEAVAMEFAARKVPTLIRPEALDRLRWHRRYGHTCVLVSASLIHYVGPWARTAGFDHVIASRLETDSADRVTGRLDGGNCYGAEKARRLEELIANKGSVVIYAYGDSRGDREMLAMADYSFFRTIPTGGPS